MLSTIVECPAAGDVSVPTVPTSAVSRLPIELWHRILSLVVHIPHLDSTYDDAFSQSHRTGSVPVVQRAVRAARDAARVLACVCALWRAFVGATAHRAIVLSSPHDWAVFLAAVRQGAQEEGAEPPRSRSLTATRRIDVLFSLGDTDGEVQTYLRGLEEIVRACPNLCSLRIQEPRYPRVLRSQETTNMLHRWPSAAGEPDGAAGGAGPLGTAADRLRAFHFHPQFDNERALDWSTLPGVARTFAHLRLLSCTIAFSSRWHAFRPPFTTESVGVSLPMLEILHIAWMTGEASTLAGFDEPAVHLPQYFRKWDLPRLRHLRVHRVNSAFWGIILALLNHNSPKLESLSINVPLFYTDALLSLTNVITGGGRRLWEHSQAVLGTVP